MKAFIITPGRAGNGRPASVPDPTLDPAGAQGEPGRGVHARGARPLVAHHSVDVGGGGSSTEALIGLAMGAIEAGMCHTVALFRSMNGHSEVRIGATGVRAAQPVRGLALAQRPVHADR